MERLRGKQGRENSQQSESGLWCARPSPEDALSHLAAHLPQGSLTFNEMQSAQASATFFWELPENKPFPYLKSWGIDFVPECLRDPQPWYPQGPSWGTQETLSCDNLWFCCYCCCGGCWQMRKNFFSSPFGLKFLLRHNIYVWIGYGRIIEYTYTIYIGQIKVLQQ